MNHHTLEKTLEQKRIAEATFDAFESETPDDLEFLLLPNLMINPHADGNANVAPHAMRRSTIH